MKWLKTQNGNIIRLGAVSEFIPYGCSMDILIGETKETAYQYDHKEQAELVYENLFSFITDVETNNGIFSFPKNDANIWLKSYSFYDFDSEMKLSIRVYNACLRGGVRTVYDIMPTEDGGERCFRNIGKIGAEELRQKREEFIERHKVKKNRRGGGRMNEKLESLIKKLDDLETQKRQVREEIEKVNREINKKRRNMSKSRQDANDARNREIYELLKNGCTAQYLSEKYSLSVTRIYGIKNNIECKDSYNEKYPDFVGLSSHLQKIFTISKIKNKEDLIDRLSSDEGFNVGAFAHLGKITLQELEDFVGFDIYITIVKRKENYGTYIWKDRILKRKIQEVQEW